MIFGEAAEERYCAPYLLAHRGDLHGALTMTPFAVSSRRASPAPRKSSSAREPTLGFATRPIRAGSTAMMPGLLH
jgi:hypothetical protein